MDHTQLRPFRFADVLATVQAGQPCVLVTVTDVQGSAPREPGTLMLVGTDGFFGTIGGSLGPTLAGLAFDHTGSYKLAFTVLVALMIAAMLLTLSLPRSRGGDS